MKCNVMGHTWVTEDGEKWEFLKNDFLPQNVVFLFLYFFSAVVVFQNI